MLKESKLVLFLLGIAIFAGFVSILSEGDVSYADTSSCETTLSANFKLSIPILIFGGGFYNLGFQYSPSSDGIIWFKLIDVAVTSDAVCPNYPALTFNADRYVFHVPALDLGGMSYWMDLEYVPTSDGLIWAKLANYGANSDLDLFSGTYSFITQYDLNISDGVALGAGTETIEVTRIDSNNLTLNVSGYNPSEGSYSGQFPLVISGNIATLPTRPYFGTAKLLDLLLLSDGNNMVYAGIGQEMNNSADISLSVANWLKVPKSVTVDSFVGTWIGTSIYGDPNLRDTTGGFSLSSVGFTISKVDDITISVSAQNEIVLLHFDGIRATLLNAPVSSPSAIQHAISFITDGTGRLSFYMVATELNDVTDVSITLGLAQRQ